MVARRPNIWKLQANKDTNGLIAALSYSDPGVRKRAAAALRVLGAIEAVPALKQILTIERHPGVRNHIIATLEHLDTTFAEKSLQGKSFQELVTMLSSPNPADVIRAAETLGTMGDQLATESLVVVFRNPIQRDDIRLAAAEALLKLKSAPAVVTLLAGLRKENWRVRHNAAAVLGQLRATWATEPLVEALEDEHPNVRRASAMALRRFQTPRALEALETYKTRHTGKTAPLSIRRAAPRSTTPKPDVKPPTVEDAPDVGSADPKADTKPKPPAGLAEAIQRIKQPQSKPNAPATLKSSESPSSSIEE